MSDEANTRCDEIRAQATGLASLPSDDDERREAMRHAESCAGCRLALGEGEGLLRILDSGGAQPEPAGDVMARVRGAVLAEMVTARRPRRAWLPAAAALAGWPLLLVLDAHALARAAETLRAPAIAASVGVAVAASGLLWLATARTRLALALLGVLAAACTLAEIDPAALAAPGFVCGGLEQVAALLPLAATAWLLARGTRAATGPLAYATAATAGAVVGLGALHLTCPNHSLQHLVAFHLGGVLLSAVIGAATGLGVERYAARAAT